MREKIDINKTLGDFVTMHPKTRRIFDKFGLDYCCGGKQEIKIAAKEKNIDLNELVCALEKAITEPNMNVEKIWLNESLTNIINHILTKHHAYLWNELPHIEELLIKVIKVHGLKHGDVLNHLNNIYIPFKTKLEKHLRVEEIQLFPYFKRFETSTNKEKANNETDFRKMIDVLYKEHEEAGNELSQMRNLTLDYLLPDDACASFKALYEDLQSIEDDLHEHIHLENNVLFPRLLVLINN